MNQPCAPLIHIPAHLFSVPAYELQAPQHLSAEVWAYLQGGAQAEITQNANLAAWQSLKLLPKRLQSMPELDLSTTILGQTWAHPLMLAPIAYQSLFYPHGEIATAQAAQATQSPMLVSSFATQTFHDIALHCQQPLWLQLYWQGSRSATLTLVHKALAAGFQAVVLTVDAPHTGIRDCERAAGFDIQNHTQDQIQNQQLAVNLPPNSHTILNLQDLARYAPTWDDVAWLKAQLTVPLLLKGILHIDDAQQALALGIDGLVLSNHGGRVLDECVTVLDVLPTIRAMCPTDYPLLVDSGLRRGTHVYKAIALGASAVLIGRPYIYGLAVAGALGAAHVLQLLQQELTATMLQCGCGQLQQIYASNTVLLKN